MEITISDIARHAGVSETTISLAFQANSRVSDETREKVLESARYLGYVPNAAARNLRQGKPKALVVLINDITNPFYAQIVRSVEATAEAAGYQVTVMESQWNPERELAAINRILQMRAQGVLICLCEKTNESLNLMCRHDVPYVVLDTFPLDYKGPYVANDLVVAGKLAAEHLCNAGYKKPVIVVPKSDNTYHGFSNFSAFDRLIGGFSEAIRNLKVPFSSGCIVNAGLTIEDGLDVLPRILNNLPEVDAILCANDLCALGVIEAIDKWGRKVGQDIGVMGIDDLGVSSLNRISLTSVRQPYKEISELATKSLIESIKNCTSITIRETMLPTLIPRDSTNRNLK